MICTLNNTTDYGENAIPQTNSGKGTAISSELRRHIETLVRKVVLEGEALEDHIEHLTHFCEADGIKPKSLETHLPKLFEIIEEWRFLPKKDTSKAAKEIGYKCWLSDMFIDELLKKVDKDKETKRIRRKVRKAKRFPLPMMLLLTTLAVTSILEIKAIGWFSLFPLFINTFIGMQAYNKREKGVLKPGFIFRGGLLMLVVFWLAFLYHWWMFLLTPIAIYTFLIDEDVE